MANDTTRDTPRPGDAAPRFRPVEIVDCGLVKRMETRVVSPVDDLAHVDGTIWTSVAPLVLRQIRAAGLEREIWQAFAVLPDIRSVGVMGDERTYESTCVLRAVSSAEWSGQYSFSEYELGGPGVDVEKFSAGNSTSNPHVDDKEIGGLIKLEEGAGPLITVNFRLPLGN